MVHDDDELNGMMKENAKSIKEYEETQQGGWIEMETYIMDDYMFAESKQR